MKSVKAVVGAALPALCMLAAGPTSALAQDYDGDTVLDGVDAYPCDASMSGVGYAPGASVRGTLLFEDLWPSAGDLDFNDLVLGYHYEVRTSTLGVTRLLATYDVRALGLVLNPGLGLQLPVSQDQVAAVRHRVDGGDWNVPHTRDEGGPFTVRVHESLLSLFGESAAAGYVNTESDRPRVAPVRIELEVDFVQPLAFSLADAPFDLFIYRSDDWSHQIHLPRYGGTQSMDASLFGSADDGSTAGRHFVDTYGLPFVLDIPGDAVYPVERTPISSLYPQITTFAASAGTQAQDYYLTPDLAHAYADSEGNGAPAVAAVPARPADLSCILEPWPTPSARARSGGCFWSWRSRTSGFSFSGAGINGTSRWFRMDYGAPKTLTAVRISAWNGTYRKGGVRYFRIETSDDASSWTEIYRSTHPNASGWRNYSFPAATARYFRIVIWGTYMNISTSCGRGQFQGAVDFFNP